jgi:hypothetical protein
MRRGAYMANLTESVYGSQPTQSAWIVAFGPIGSGADGYLLRVEATAHAMRRLGFDVRILEVSKRSQPVELWSNVVVHPAWPFATPGPRVLGSLNLFAELRVQLALLWGLRRNWRELRSAAVVIIEGGLLAPTIALRALRKNSRPTLVFDVITVMSDLHRHGQRDSVNAQCNLRCRLRRQIWRLLEQLCTWGSDVTVVCAEEDMSPFLGRRVRIVPHSGTTKEQDTKLKEDPGLIAFLGSGRLAPNREALDFIVTGVLDHPRLRAVRCRVIGDRDGYRTASQERLEFTGFRPDLSEAMAPVSVFCAPIKEAGGVSTKVLTALLNGKRTVCSPEAARGIKMPPAGLWIADRSSFAQAVADALGTPWSPADAQRLRVAMAVHHDLDAIAAAWQDAVGAARSGSRQPIH